MVDRRVAWGYLAPVCTGIVLWALWMSTGGSWRWFAAGWPMSLTMALGSFVAGASPEGGGAVAFPVMTLVMGIDPPVARNFSLAIQSVGMTAASLWILARRVPIERTYFARALIGGTLGIVLGTFFVAPHVPPVHAKLTFVSFWLAFGIALFAINHVRRRQTVDTLGALTSAQKLEILGVGVIGGVLSAVYGNGLDICTFAYVTLKHDLSEKVGTPTSVMLMASNAVVGTVLHGLVIGDLQPAAIEAWAVCVPIVTFGAPLGAHVVSVVDRLWIAGLLYTLIAVQFVAAFAILRPDGGEIAVAATAFAIGIGLFFVLTRRRAPSAIGVAGGGVQG